MEASVPPNCRSACNNLYSGISLVCQVRSLISLPCSISLYFWSFLVSSFPHFLVSSFPCFLVSLFPRFLVSSLPRFLFHNLRSDPRSRPRSHQRFRRPVRSCDSDPPFTSAIPISVLVPVSGPHFRSPFPLPIPVLLSAPRGSSSRCLPLCFHAALLYNVSSVRLRTVTRLDHA